MLMMRLQRVGRKNNPSYRVLIVDSRQGPKSGKFVDQVGSYDPKVNRIEIDGEKARAWISKGVQTSNTVHNLLVGQKIIEGKKVNALPKKSPIKKEGEEAPAEAAAPAAEASATEDAAPAAEEAPADAAAEATPEPEAPAAEDAPVDAPAEEAKA